MINHLGSLKREFHHIKAMRDGHEEYEPVMVVFKDGVRGRSYEVSLNALWKFLDPSDNQDMEDIDEMDFYKIGNRVYWERKLAINPARTAEDCAAIMLAEEMNANCGLMKCVGYNLVKCCQTLDITVEGSSMIQLFMFIQDGLDELRKMPLPEPEDTIIVGEVNITIDGKKYTREVTLAESDMLQGGE